MTDLNGIWSFSAEGKGRMEIRVPGCWENILEEKDFAGPARLRRIFDLPRMEPGMRQILCFGGVSYYCDIFVNGSYLGSHEGMWDRFRMDATDFLAAGTNEIELAVWKPGYRPEDRFKVREVLSGFIPDVCTTFGGIWDDVYLSETKGPFVESHRAEADMKQGRVTLKARVKNYANTEANIELCWEVRDAGGAACGGVASAAALAAGEERTVNVQVPLENIIPWDTENPYLYSYCLTVKDGGFEHKMERRFGMREIRAEGSKILLNGRPVYLRGILHWGCYDGIIPNPPEETIRNELAGCREYGFNMVKHCLYIPREKYFELADEMGILQWIELPLWLPDVTPGLSGRMAFEYPRILEQISGYASTVLCSLGCELNSAVDAGLLERMYRLAKEEGGTMLVRDNSGSGECYEGLPVDFADFYDYHFYGDLQHMEPLMEAFTAGWREMRPWLYGEFCDSDTLRSPEHLRKRCGAERLWWEMDHPSLNPVSRLKPDFRVHLYDSRMEKYGMKEAYGLLRKLSLAHSLVHRKLTLELTRSFPEIGGYNITALRDVPIAASGLFDDGMDPKFDAAEFRCFNNDVVLSPAWDLTRIWINGDRVLNRERFNFRSGGYYGLHVIISNYSAEIFSNPQVHWEITDGKHTVARWDGTVEKRIFPGEVGELVYVSARLPEVDHPAGLLLKVKMAAAGRSVENAWPLWVLPEDRVKASLLLYDPAGLLDGLDETYEVRALEDCREVDACDAVITTRVTPPILKYMEEGGKVFLLQRGEGWLKTRKTSFWRESFIREYDHEVLRDIRPNRFNDLKYFSLATDTAIDTFALEGVKAVPILRRYDCREFDAGDYLAELEIGKGRLIATTLRFEGGMGKQPCFIKNNPLACYLLDRIIACLLKRKSC